MKKAIAGALVLALAMAQAHAQTSTAPQPPEQTQAPAQTPPPAPAQAPAETTAPAQTQEPAAAVSQSQPAAQQKLSQGQIEQLVAPIALYPDSLLSQVLMASTYPLEVVEAARWARANSKVKGKALEDAMQKQSWDPSVKALTAVPQTLQMMNDKLDWTQKLGDAFLAQQQDVLDTVQKLRARADAAGNLKSTPQQRVTKARPPAGVVPPPGMQEVIMIEPVDPDLYYVPVYDPALVYGVWGYPDYPPYYWYPPGYVATGIFAFTAGVVVGAAIWGGCDWWRRNVYVNVNRYNAFNRTNINVANNAWVHNPVHRGNVPYRDAGVAQRFGNINRDAGRDAFRNRTGTGQPGLSNLGSKPIGNAAKNIGAGNAARNIGAGNAAKNIGAGKTAKNMSGVSRAANISRSSGPKQVSGVTNRAVSPRSNIARVGGGGGPHFNAGSVARIGGGGGFHGRVGGGGGGFHGRVGGGGGFHRR